MGTRENTAVYDQVIDANRQFIDHAYGELFSVFKAMPTVDSFDIIGATFRHADAIGAQASVNVRKAAQEAVGSKDWNKFYAYANSTWREAAEKSVEAIQAAKRAIVWNYIVNEAPSKLKWTDDFAGDYQLLAPAEQAGVWLVRDDKGRTVEMVEEGYQAGTAARMTPAQVDATFTVQGRTARNAQKAATQQYESAGNGLFVPRSIIDDYRRVVAGDPEDAVDDLLEAIDGAVTEVPQATVDAINAQPELAQKITNVVDEVAPTVDETAETLTPGVNETAQVVDEITPVADEVAPAVDVPTTPQNANVRAVQSTQPAKAGRITTTREMRRAAGIAGIGTEKTDIPLVNSINRHAKEMGLDAVKIKRLSDLTPEDSAKVVAYYKERAAQMGRNAWDDAYTAADEARLQLQYIEDGKKEIENLIRNADAQRSVTSATTKNMGGRNRVKDWIAYAKKKQDFGDETWIREFEEKLQEFSPNATLGQLLNQWEKLDLQIPGLKATIKDSEQFIRRRGGKIVPFRKDEIVDAIGQEAMDAMGLTADDVAQMDRRTLLRMYESYTEKSAPEWTDLQTNQPSYFAGGLGVVPTKLPGWMVPRWKRKDLWKTPQMPGQWFADGDAYETLKSGIKTARTRKGAPEVGDMALSQIKAIDDVRNYVMGNLETILAGRPNTLTPQQQLQAIDIAAKVLMPAWDNVLRAASESGQKMGNFAMMDFNDRRNIDTLLSLVMPFHYYWSRSAGNWVQRVVAKPQWLDFWYESQRAVGIENRQTETVDGQQVEKPQRLQGTIPNPFAGVGEWMPDRIQNPTTWGLPFEMYLGYNRADEPDTESQVIKVQNNIASYFAEKTFPWIQAGAAKWMDEIWPLEDGEKRFDAFDLTGPKNTIQAGDYFPAQRLVGYGLQALGAIGQPSGRPWSFGDEWDAYLIGRQARNMVQTGEIKETGGLPPDEIGNYIQQMALNVSQGKPVETGIPPEHLDTVRPLYQQAVRGEGGEKFARNVGAFLTGFTNQFYPEAEKEYQAAANQYHNFGYGPANLGGSKEAKDAILADTPSLGVQFNQKTLVPGATGLMSPAEDAQVSELHRKAKALTAQRDAEATAAGEAAARAGKDVYDARDPVYKKYADQIDAIYAQINAIESKYPGEDGQLAATSTDGTTFTPKAVRTAEDVATGTFPGGRNPQEYKDLQVEDVFREASATYPYDDNASGADKRANAQAKEKFAIDKLVGLGFSADEAKKMYEENKVRNLSPLERQAVERARQAAEERDWANDKLWTDRGNWVRSAYGEDAYKIWDAYFDLPKDSAARQAYRDAHPELKAYNLAAYQPDGYAFLTGKYGDSAVMDWATAPKWSPNKADQAIRTAYFDERPGAWMVGAWVNGRPEPFDPDGKPEQNYGKDYKQAEELFGPDIWERVYQYKGTPRDQRKGLFKELGLQDWNDWWYGLLPEDEKRYAMPSYAYRGGGGGGRGGGGGGRSYGGGGGGGGGYGGGGSGTYIRTPFVEPRGMDFDLLVKPEDIRPWRRQEFNDDFLYAGRQLTPNSGTSWRKWRG
jgi:hypothetical protein